MEQNEQAQWDKLGTIKGFEPLAKYKSLPLAAAAGLLDREFITERLKEYDDEKAACDKVRDAFLESSDPLNKTKEGSYDVGYQVAMTHAWMEISVLAKQLKQLRFAIGIAHDTLTAIKEDSKLGALLSDYNQIDEKTMKKLREFNDKLNEHI